MEFAVLSDFLMMSRENWLEPTIVAGRRAASSQIQWFRIATSWLEPR